MAWHSDKAIIENCKMSDVTYIGIARCAELLGRYKRHPQDVPGKQCAVASTQHRNDPQNPSRSSHSYSLFPSQTPNLGSPENEARLAQFFPFG